MRVYTHGESEREGGRQRQRQRQRVPTDVRTTHTTHTLTSVCTHADFTDSLQARFKVAVASVAGVSAEQLVINITAPPTPARRAPLLAAREGGDEDTYGTYEDTYGTYEDTYGTYAPPHRVTHLRHSYAALVFAPL